MNKVYILQRGIYSDRKMSAYDTREKAQWMMDAAIKLAWLRYKDAGHPEEYRNAKRINFPTYKKFKEDRMMEYEIIELEVN